MSKIVALAFALVVALSHVLQARADDAAGAQNGGQNSIPGRRQVLRIPSLTQSQSAEIGQIYKTLRADTQPMVHELKDLQATVNTTMATPDADETVPGKSGTGHQRKYRKYAISTPTGQAIDAVGQNKISRKQLDPAQARKRIQVLKEQIKDKKERSWEQVKALLNDAQVKELEQIRTDSISQSKPERF